MPMTLMLGDLAQYACATFLALALLLLPGFGLLTILSRFGQMPDRRSALSWAMLLGIAVLPAIDALAIRYAGMILAMALHTSLAIAGLSNALQNLRRVSARWLGIAVLWWGIVAFVYTDVDWGGGLYQSLTVLDLVKHAAVVRTIAHDGLPLQDMFFARPGNAGYYYYFYIGPALIHWLAREAIDARAAFMAASFVTGLVFPQLLMLLATKAGLVPSASRQRFLYLCALLCAVSGLDLIPAVLSYIAQGRVLAQLDWWGEETRWALTSIVWVPHHIAALIAVLVGSLVLVARTETGIAASTIPRTYPASLAILSGLAFATAFGSSLWVTLAAAPILTIWWLAGLRRTDMPAAWLLPVSGAIALTLSLPQIRDLLLGRVSAGFPLGFYIRSFGEHAEAAPSLWNALARTAMLPGIVTIEFGLFALGTVAFVTSGRARESCNNPIGRLLIIGAITSLVTASFVRSTVINNDFGWRAIWFTQIATLIWTAALLTQDRKWLRGSSIRMATLVLGLMATAYDLTGLRFIRPPRFMTQMDYINRYPDMDAQLRHAYVALDQTIPHSAVVQHNPVLAERVLDFGLYGHNRVAVADSQAQLFGASKAQVEIRIARLAPLFERAMPFADARRIAHADGVDYLVVTSLDPAWQIAGHVPDDWPCIYRSRDVCVAPVSTVKEKLQ
jgi:hypothetical protein